MFRQIPQRLSNFTTKFSAGMMRFHSIRFSSKLKLSGLALASLKANEKYRNDKTESTKKQNKNICLLSNEKFEDIITVKPELPKFDAGKIGGNEEALASMNDIISYLQDPKKFVDAGITPPKGIVLSGPPGVGKTILAEAVAGHAGVTIIKIGASELIGAYTGWGEKKLRDLFELANNNAPCVLCIDEIESIGKTRISSTQSTNAHYINTMTNMLLTLMDKNRPGVVVIATTNNFNDIDPAVVRPGRFDRHINLSLPDLAARENILKVHLQNKKLQNIDLKTLAKLSIGFSGAKIANWVNEAALLSMKENAKTITEKHFYLARNLLQTGSTFLKSHPTLEEKRFIANHEAGHALIGHLLKLDLYKISIFKTNLSRGYTEFLPKEKGTMSLEEMKNEICMLLSGRAAEKVLNSHQIGSKNDLQDAKDIAIKIINDGFGSTLTGTRPEIDAEIILKQEMNRAVELLKKNLPTLKNLSDALVEREELSKTEFLEIMAGKKLPNNKTFTNRMGYKSSLVPSRFFALRESILQEDMLTIEKIANVLDLDKSLISKISFQFKRCKILFNDVVDIDPHASKLEKKSKELKENQINNFIMPSRCDSVMSYPPSLYIESDSIEKFIKYIREKNEPKFKSKL